MSETKEKHQPLLTLTTLIASRVQIQAIRLLNARVNFNQSEILEGLTIQFAFETETIADRNDNKISVTSKFQVFAQKDKENDLKKAPVKISADYGLEYSINSFENVEQENIEAFGHMNGIYNAWPYWREFVQSMTTRMGLPPLTLPVITGAFLENYYKESKRKSDQEK